MKYYDVHGEYCSKEYTHFVRKSEYDHLKQLLHNVRATLHFSPEDVLAIDAALRENEE